MGLKPNMSQEEADAMNSGDLLEDERDLPVYAYRASTHQIDISTEEDAAKWDLPVGTTVLMANLGVKVASDHLDGANSPGRTGQIAQRFILDGPDGAITSSGDYASNNASARNILLTHMIPFFGGSSKKNLGDYPVDEEGIPLCPVYLLDQEFETRLENKTALVEVSQNKSNRGNLFNKFKFSAIG